MAASPIILALPKGRIQEEVVPILRRVGIEPEPSFFDDHERQLMFGCRGSDMKIIRVRSFDVATFVMFGGAHLGICGSDVLMEYDYPDLYAPLDLGIGRCRLSVACAEGTGVASPLGRESHIRVATKYPMTTRRFFAGKGIQAECIKLSGAMELAPKLGLADHIVDLVSSGKTLAANGLREIETIADISSRLIVNRVAFKTRSAEINGLLGRCREAVHGA
jgi:ATP phosphoribosyltransferase